jgi:hypothetical protein
MKKKFQRSDIPYKDRLLMQKHQNIADHRNEAARIALQIACVALNDTEGLGYQRLSRFAKRLQQLVAEYYQDTEVGDAHLKTRLEQLGFLVVDGHMFAAEDAQGKVVDTKLLEKPVGGDGGGKRN